MVGNEDNNFKELNNMKICVCKCLIIIVIFVMSPGMINNVCADSTYNQQRAGADYEAEYDDFGTLFSNFITDLKGKSLFSVSSNITSNVPGSSITLYQLNFGSYGSHTFDFSGMSTALLVFKEIILILFATYALRIVILKGDDT
jgi:hypothetical protein